MVVKNEFSENAAETAKENGMEGDSEPMDTSAAEDATESQPLDTSIGNISTTTANKKEDETRKQFNASPAIPQDTHPYARGSVVEVWLKSSAQQNSESWWSEPDSSEDDDEEKTLRLCDIIDRAPAAGSYRYYIHYRDLNRRMDEWIAADRIVSPPSVGNAKARALKRLEEKQKKRQEKAAAAEALRSRRWADDNEGRKRRQSRRKSTTTDDNDATLVASNNEANNTMNDMSDDNTLHDGNNPLKKKEAVIVTVDAVTTHTVGEHVVATVQAQELDEHEGLDEASLREHEEVTKVKNVNFLELGEYQMETWYFSPLPKELLGPNGYIEILYVCEFTFTLFARKCELRRFQSRLATQQRHPPGNEIYRNGNLAMFEVDGLSEKIYCQNLCYIAKLFLDHKTLYFDVDPFLFYVLCEVDDRGFHPAGYYSKEKYSDVGYNLACILTFPAHQRKGYGRFLIAFSYELTKKEEKVGSPEKPMSDLGQQAYKPYWASTILDYLLNQSHESSLSIMDISKRTSIMAEDIVFTLNQLGILKILSGVYFIAAEKGLLETLAKKYPVKEPRVDPSKLHWTPFLTDIKRDKFSIYSKKPSLEADDAVGMSRPGSSKA